MSAHPVFTPSALSAQERNALTVGRTRLFGTLVDRIRSAARDGSRPHTLLVAPRGGGKTHTLHVSVDRALAQDTTAKNVLSVVIPEDSLAIGAYIDLLVEIARAIDPDLAEVARRLRQEKDPIGIEAAIMATAGERMILLAIENLDRVFDSLGAAGQGSLRAWVETSAAILVLATSPALFSGVSSRSYPWYGSFIVETLPELTVHDGAQLLIRAAHRRGDSELAAFIDSAQGRERLSAIHRLAGGSPRLWHILSDCVDVDSLDALVPAVETLLDRLAPYYQQQLWQLPAGEQRLVVELARGWQPRTVSDLAAAVGVSNQSAATALGRLTEARWVTSSKAHTGDRRASWYDLTEPLLRYHLQFRDDRGKPLRLIVEFLRAFYLRDRSLAKLGQAVRDSPLQRYLQDTLLDGADTWYQPPGGDLSALAGTIRRWAADDSREIAEVAFALEALLSEVLGTPGRGMASTTTAPVVANAIAAAREASGSTRNRLLAGLIALGAGHWTPEQQDTLLLVELIWANPECEQFSARLAASSAHRKRRTSELAVALRLTLASTVLDDGEPDAAVVTLNALIDDLADIGQRRSDLVVAWGLWARAVSQAANAIERRVPDAKPAGTGIALAVMREDVTWTELPKIMSALPKKDASEVAVHIAFTARAADVELPHENGPLGYLDAGGRDFIGFADKVLASP